MQLRTSGSESFEQNEDIEFASAMQGTHVQGTYIYLCTGHVHLSMLKRPPSPNFAEKAALVSALFLSSYRLADLVLSRGQTDEETGLSL